MNRKKLDAYYSPGWYVTHLPNYVELDGVVGEPCCGSGNLSNILQHMKKVKGVWTNDIDPTVQADQYLDAAISACWEHPILGRSDPDYPCLPEADWIVTNPPFNQAMTILKNAYHFAKKGVVLFVRHSFFEPTEDRAKWLYEHPPWGQVVYPRFKYLQDATGRWVSDSNTIVAGIWMKDIKTCLGVRVAPRERIVGFYDNPTKDPGLEQHIKNLKEEECLVEKE